MRVDPSSLAAIANQVKRMLQRTPRVAASKHLRNMSTDEGWGGEDVERKERRDKESGYRRVSNECGYRIVST